MLNHDGAGRLDLLLLEPPIEPPRPASPLPALPPGDIGLYLPPAPVLLTRLGLGRRRSSNVGTVEDDEDPRGVGVDEDLVPLRRRMVCDRGWDSLGIPLRLRRGSSSVTSNEEK